jgi:glucose/arabinose dehydrogenase
VFAQGTGNPRMMKVMPDGSVYVTDRNNGTLMLLTDRDKNGKIDKIDTLIQMEHLHGIDLFKGKLYLVTVKDVYSVDLRKDGLLGNIKPIITDLPDAGQHHNRTLKFGPDTMMYISAGSTCNICEETNKEAATMMRCRPDGSERIIYSRGLRNTIGFDWHPQTKELWGWDNGMDQLGDTVSKEELNQLKEGADYGWPFIYDKGQFERHHDPKNSTHEEYVKKTTFPDILYDAHAASMEFIFYTGAQFPDNYRNDGFVAMRGSWNTKAPVGYRVLRVKLNKAGKPTGTEDFLTGFLVDNNTSEFGRPVGIAQYIDGSLLISDDVNGIIYRIYYKQ